MARKRRVVPYQPELLELAPQRCELTVLSDGSGQNSAAILRLLIHDPSFRRRYAPGRLLVVHSETGDEHEETNDYLNEEKELCRKAGIEFCHLVPELGFHSPAWRDLRFQYRRNSTFGSFRFKRLCTINLKIEPFYKFLEEWVVREYGLARKGCRRKRQGLVEFALRHGRIRVLIGFDRAEGGRVAGPESYEPWRRIAVETVYPLIDLEIDRKGCQECVARLGGRVPIPSACRLCHFQTLPELLLMERTAPRDLEEWVEIERAKLKKFVHLGERNRTVYREGTLPEMVARARREHGAMSTAELYAWRFSRGHCVNNSY